MGLLFEAVDRVEEGKFMRGVAAKLNFLFVDALTAIQSDLDRLRKSFVFMPTKQA